MVVVDHLVHKYDEILCPVHHGGHPASYHGPPVGEGHGEASPKIQGTLVDDRQDCIDNAFSCRDALPK